MVPSGPPTPTPDFVNEIKPIGVGFLLQCRDPIGALSVNLLNPSKQAFFKWFLRVHEIWGLHDVLGWKKSKI